MCVCVFVSRTIIANESGSVDKGENSWRQDNIESALRLYVQASAHQKNLDVGANVFIGNLDPEVDEKLLYDTFSAFGVILQTPKVGGSM